jgi:hypothetical protein
MSGIMARVRSHRVEMLVGSPSAAIAPQGRSSIGDFPLQDPSPRLLRIVGDITLMEGWTSDNPDRIFTNQAFEIRAETKSSRLGRDGHLIVTCRPMNVTWYGGKAEHLQDVTHVRIVTRGCVLIDETLDTRHGPSKVVPGGTSFDLTSQI